MTEDEWVTVWMLGVVKKRQRLDKFVYQALGNVIKLGGDNVIQNFEEKFKELRVEGCQKENGLSTSVMFTEDDKEMEEDDSEDDPKDSHTETEDKETLFMGTLSEAKRFNRNGPYRSRPSS